MVFKCHRWSQKLIILLGHKIYSYGKTMPFQTNEAQVIICNPYWFNLASIFNVAPASSQRDNHRLSLGGVNKPFRKIIQLWYGDIAISWDLVKLTNNCREM